VSTSTRVFVIAEAGVNHDGSPARAIELVDIAAEAGADAVKFQSFRAGNVVSRWAAKAAYQERTTGADESQLDMIRKLELDVDAHRAVAARCRLRGIEFMSTAFDNPSLQMLLGLGIQRVKVPSGEVTNPLLLLDAVRAGKPIILSTGMSTLADIREALGVLAFGCIDAGPPSRAAFASAFASEAGQAALRDRVTLLHCTSQYPAPVDSVHLRAMDTMRAEFGLPVGYSDHTLGITVPIAAAARGAVVIEKHFTSDRRRSGPDHGASAEPDELKRMVSGIREVELALGGADKIVYPCERDTQRVARRSLVAAVAIAAGERFTESNVVVKRPGTGVEAMRYWEVLGRVARRSYDEDELLDETPNGPGSGGTLQ
jgi:N-acetylneuraminate synthase